MTVLVNRNVPNPTFVFYSLYNIISVHIAEASTNWTTSIPVQTNTVDQVWTPSQFPWVSPNQFIILTFVNADDDTPNLSLDRE